MTSGRRHFPHGDSHENREICVEPFSPFPDSTTMTALTDFNSPRALAQSLTSYFYFYMALA
ncbi:MAG: hypothetical protein ACXWLJ_10665, partial [Rhizomicrobium sp.]